jgi:hypothetical protein
LASRNVDLEVIVLDDASEDATADIVRHLAQHDRRLRLETAPPLPPGWNGKQHACHALSTLASHDLLVFVDADVRLEPDALARAAAFLRRRNADLVSGFPRQITGTLGEALLVPMIHVVLLGYLPMIGMRYTRMAGFAAGCGQFFMTRRGAYNEVGGHGAIRSSRHDGITLPAAYRRAGRSTDLFDATPLLCCRMYHGLRESWNGFAKNATEGLAQPVRLPVFTVLLLGGHVLPPVLSIVLLAAGASTTAVAMAGAATGLVALMRGAMAWRFRQSIVGALLHPVGVAMLVGIQWHAAFRRLTGRTFLWKGRS